MYWDDSIVQRGGDGTGTACIRYFPIHMKYINLTADRHA